MTPARELAERIEKEHIECLSAEEREKYIRVVESIIEEALWEAFARGQEKKASCVCSAMGVCGLHAPMIEEARAEEREACAKIADEDDQGICTADAYCRCSPRIAEQIRGRGKK